MKKAKHESVMNVRNIYVPNFKSIGSNMAFISSKSFEIIHGSNFQIVFFFFYKVCITEI